MNTTANDICIRCGQPITIARGRFSVDTPNPGHRLYRREPDYGAALKHLGEWSEKRNRPYGVPVRFREFHGICWPCEVELDGTRDMLTLTQGGR